MCTFSQSYINTHANKSIFPAELSLRGCSLSRLSVLALPFLPSAPQDQTGPVHPVREEKGNLLEVKDGCVSVQWALFNWGVVSEENAIAYPLPFLSCRTWNLMIWISQETVKTCHHRKRLLHLTLKTYSKWKNRWIIISHDFFLSDNSHFWRAPLVHLCFPGNRQVHLLFHLCLEIHHIRLWNVLRWNHVSIDLPLPIRLHLIESVSPFLLQLRWALVNPDDKWKDSFMRLLVHV